MVFIRFPLIMLGHAFVLAYFALAGHPNAWGATIGMSNLTLVLTGDLGVLLLLLRLTRREGIRLSDLIRFQASRLGRDLLIALGLFVVLYATLVITGFLSVIVVYGPGIFKVTSTAQGDNGAFVRPPLWVFWWSTLVLPITAGGNEELTYRGYALPRLVALARRPWLGVLIMSLGFGLQHVAFALTDWQSALARFFGMFLTGIVFGLIYLKQQRLVPLIIAHWLIDFLGLGLFPLFAALSLS